MKLKWKSLGKFIYLLKIFDNVRDNKLKVNGIVIEDVGSGKK